MVHIWQFSPFTAATTDMRKSCNYPFLTPPLMGPMTQSPGVNAVGRAAEGVTTDGLGGPPDAKLLHAVLCSQKGFRNTLRRKDGPIESGGDTGGGEIEPEQ